MSIRTLLANFGTAGDVEPILSLGLELRKFGFDVTLAFPPRYRHRAKSNGFEFFDLGPDLETAQTAINRAWATGATDPDVRRECEPLKRALPRVLEELLRASESMDLLVSGPALPAARMLHELTGIPFVSVQVSHFGGTGSAALSELGRWLVNPLRAARNLRPVAHPFTVDANSPQLALYAMSRHLVTPDRNWPSHHKMTGFFFSDEADPGDDAGVRKFVARGAPPVVFALGAAANWYPAETLVPVVRRALRAVRCRGVLQMPGVTAETEDPDLLTIGHAPHKWLFQQASCVVTHGGSGTAAAVLRAGVPAVFVPARNPFDQTYWAQLGHEHGYSPEPIPIDRLDSSVLADRLLEVAANPEYGRRAEDLGSKIRAEAGVRGARVLIERLLERLAAAGN